MKLGSSKNLRVLLEKTPTKKAGVLSVPFRVMHLSMSGPSGGGSGNPWEFDCGIYFQGVVLIKHRAFDLSISNSRRDVNLLFLIILTIIFFPGGGDFDNFFIRKCQNSHPMPYPSGLTLIGAKIKAPKGP